MTSSSFGTVLLLQIFPALLPPKNDNDRDFYAVLDLPKGASEQDVRKAYKKKSLALHPDKQAQRGASARSAEEAAREYQLVQEAHACLSTPEGRQRYHAVQCSPTRYRFLTQEGGLANQTQIVKNLNQASFSDKTRLVLFVSLFPALLLVQPILICVKINHLLAQSGGALENASWMAILIPWWVFHSLFILFWMVVLAAARASHPPAMFAIVTTIVEQILWLIAFMVLALRWDQVITADYALVFIPVYLALVAKWVHTILLMQQIAEDMAKMVSKDHFLTVILQGREPEQLEEEELKDLHDKYVVVQQIPADVEHALENDSALKNLPDEEKEEIRVTSSKEFEAAMEAFNDARLAIFRSMLFEVAFLVLVILKVDDHAPILSWWIVFCPILSSYTARYVRTCFACCCQATPAVDPDEAVVLAAMEKKAQEEEEKTKNKGFDLESTVILHSLNTEEFNGKTGIIKGPLDAETGRQQVFIPQLNKTAALKLDNLTPMDGAGGVAYGHASINIDTTAGGNKDNSADSNDNSTPPTATDDKKEETAAEKPQSATNENKDETDQGGNGNSAAQAATLATDQPSSSPDNPAYGTFEDGEKKDNDDDDGSIHIEVDAETYRAYQSAYAAAEATAMEKRVKAGQDNCVTTIRLVMVCLLVAKLELSYAAIEEREQNEDADVDVGFNTLWLIFPLFLVAGLMMGCCACLIYSAPDPDELMQHEGENNEEGDEEAGGQDTPIVVAPPPEMDVPSPNEAASAQSTEPDAPPEAANNDGEDDAKKKEDAAAVDEQDNPTSPPPVEEDVGGDMNDLD